MTQSTSQSDSTQSQAQFFLRKKLKVHPTLPADKKPSLFVFGRNGLASGVDDPVATRGSSQLIWSRSVAAQADIDRAKSRFCMRPAHHSNPRIDWRAAPRHAARPVYMFGEWAEFGASNRGALLWHLACTTSSLTAAIFAAESGQISPLCVFEYAGWLAGGSRHFIGWMESLFVRFRDAHRDNNRLLGFDGALAQANQLNYAWKELLTA